MAARPRTVIRLAKAALSEFFAHDMPTYAAALAYRVLFSLFPFLIFVTTMLGYLGIPEFFDWMREQAAIVLPPEGMDLVNGVLDEIDDPRGGIMSVAVALAVWSASAAMLGTMNALNVAYDVKERRATWKRFLVAIGYTLALAVILLMAAAMMITGPELLGYIAQFVGLGDAFIVVWTWLRWPVAVLLLTAVLALVYWAVPNVHQPLRVIVPGCLFAVAFWMVASLGFGIYVQNFGSYDRTYGSLGAVIVLLLYFFISSAVMLLGAEINSVIAKERGDPVREAPGP